VKVEYKTYALLFIPCHVSYILY